MGGGAPVSVQSMTNTDTRDVQATLAQIRALAGAGADLVRVSVYDGECARAVRALVDGSPVPLVADIHFDHRLAIQAVENGIPTPVLSSALSYYDGYRSERLPANLLQAQRDYFGAHTYERVDAPRGEFFHTNWTGEGGSTAASTYTV